MTNRTCSRCSTPEPEGSRWVAFFEFPVDGAPTHEVLAWLREMADTTFQRTAWCSLRCMARDLHEMMSGQAAQ